MSCTYQVILDVSYWYGSTLVNSQSYTYTVAPTQTVTTVLIIPNRKTWNTMNIHFHLISGDNSSWWSSINGQKTEFLGL